MFQGDTNWQKHASPREVRRTRGSDESTYVKKPPFFESMTHEARAPQQHQGRARARLLGDSVTTDHISPAGNIARRARPGSISIERGVQPKDFNSYGARRGNHEVMVRGTFANIRLKNQLAARHRGRRDDAHPERRKDDDLRRVDEVSSGGRR